ncbi:carboxy-cis,cis-muconate cyclase [Lentilactobacillus farraginis DSM 18382 = JCM 14108]|uniref:Carboxy-cis,cis-muconate cyclase n=1 Tax=Lentilactobacillus farraginis DSM 18382 = JCM 14108 TaxID=1423743 RepID=A0A0R1W0E8_9LACO|nr:carboxy-cis,cis-muconate cyclase [Lentilactobacillus farraginis DSM 18382 = JCM 14108]
MIGTYTRRISKGVYQLELDTDNQKLQHLQFVGEAIDPTYVAESNAKRIYAITKVKGDDGNVTGGFKEWDGSSEDFPLADIAAIHDQETSPAYIAVDETRHLVFTANYHAGTICTYKIGDDGSITRADRIMDKGTLGFRPEQQDGPHPHYINLTPDNRVVAVDLGVDKVFIYDLDNNGKLTPVSELQMEDGYGPRHIAFDEKKGVAYLVGELSSNLAVLDYDEQTGKLSLRSISSTIPEDWTTHNGAAAIRVSKDGRFVYVSNRGNNTIAVFSSDEKGDVRLVQRISTEGDFPRDFNFSDDESFVICVNQNSDNGTLYTRDAENGKLTMVQKDVQVPEPVCVLRKK